ncbi:hypothetical protein L288_04800 [Sphingobium quisquiliarum P25]|uniref:HPr kinase n=1 Tax=Sphingobium quisquiliarum P25 TaxID=1329909 RepID=T0H196_9SPHN|nr:hypothetical protein [Sphingobium quisquiliarum]EQB10136.1 hypothetical protein L288_04800 [Sphingobium quisquiliarum P25]
MMLRLSHGTSIVFIDGQPLIFSSGSQSLLGMNQIAGYVGCRLEEGIPFAQLAQEVLERGFAEPRAMLRAVLANWSLRGLVNACDPPPSSRPLSVQRIAIGGVRFALRHHDRVLAARVAPLFTHLETGGDAAAITYDLWQDDGMACLSRDGEPASVMQVAQAAPVIKARIADDILKSPVWLLALHAGCLHRNGKALLILGEPGAGKTTLTSWLTGQGFVYGGDDITVAGDDGRVTGLPFLPSVKSGAWKLLAPVYEDLSRLPVHVRPDRRRVRFPAPREMAGGAPARIGWIVKLRRSRSGPARLEEMPSAVALKHLLAEATSRSRGMARPSLDVMIAAAAAARCCELHYTRLDDASRLLKLMCDDEPA